MAAAMGIAATILDTLEGLLSECVRPVPLHEPTFRGCEWDYVKDCIDTGWVSTAGAYVDRFEQMLQELTGSRCAVAVVNGSAALHVALVAIGVERGDEVIVPALTFAGTANAVLHAGAVPHFAESSPATLGIDGAALGRYLEQTAVVQGDRCINTRSGRRIAAVVPVHVFGHAVDMDALLPVCERFHLPIVEDAAESLGSYYRAHHTGTQGQVGVLSFNGNKTITTGGGGALLTQDEEMAARLKHLTTTAKVAHRWRYFHDEPGFNYRMPNLNAALGCAQLEQLDRFLHSKRSLAARYIQAFDGIDGVEVVVEPEGSKSNYWINAIKLVGDAVHERDTILEGAHQAGLLLRPAWEPMHELPMYRDCPAMDLSCAEDLARRIINLPSSSHLEVT